ncbi:MAG TPA: VWA domain-containing protein [Blastocatellia bacterium]
MNRGFIGTLCVCVLVWSQALNVLAFQAGTTNSSQKADQKSDQKITIGTSEVLLDVVVRDKKGKPVKDLGAVDFEIYEDGVKQDIKSFRVHQSEAGEYSATAGSQGTGAAATSGRVSGPPNPFAGLGVVALVFDRLSPNARELARKAAQSYVSSIGKDDLAGVFLIDLSMKVLQPFTNNTDLLSKAVDQAGSLATSNFTSNANQTADLAAKIAVLEEEGAAPNPGVAQGGSGGRQGSGPPPGNSAFELAEMKMTFNILSMEENLERDDQGYATTNSLLAVVNSLKAVEGRKAVIYFSEGMAIPPAVERRFRAVISAANHANVSIYPIDAAGLRTDSTLAATAKQQNAIMTERMAVQETGAEDTTGKPMTRSLERNEDVLRLDPNSGLGELADQTGGFAIKDTNSLKSGLSRIDEDLRFHYVLSYVPKQGNYDGQFRKISVKLDKAALDVQTRKGYYALPPTGDSPVLEYEAPALAALTTSKAKPDPALQAGAFSFPESGKPGLVPIIIEAPAQEFTHQVDKAKSTYNSDFSLMAVVKDQSGQIVTKLSQHYQLSGPADKLDEAKQGEVLFYRETQLPPGKYSVEVIEYDALGGKSGTKTATVEVPAAGSSTLRMSSIAVLQRVEKLSDADKNTDNPFHYKERLIYPNLGQPLMKSAAKQVAFFCTIYPAKGTSAPPTLDIKILQGGAAVFDKPASAGQPDTSGRIQYAGALPLDAFPPGDYVLQITAADEHASTSRQTHFTVQP